MSVTVTVVDLDQTEEAEIRFDQSRVNVPCFQERILKPTSWLSNSWQKVQDYPTYLTVQIAEDKHIELFPDCLECVNHGCDPNCFFDTDKMEFVTFRPIAGEEFRFFTLQPSGDMDPTIWVQLCGSSQCVSMIKEPSTWWSFGEGYRFTGFIQKKLGI